MSKILHYRACHLYETICGLVIEIEGDEGGVPWIRSIKGDPQDSFSRSHVCPKAVALQDIQDDPDRLRQPLRRVSNEWQPIGWDEAFALMASRLGEIREHHDNDAMAVYQDNPSVHNYGLMTHSNYFLDLLKTHNRFSVTSVDQLSHHLVSQQIYGHGLLIPIPDIDHTNFMLVLGGNPPASNGNIMTVPDVEKCLKALKARGDRLVVVDPRRSGTAAIADRHLSIHPGQDAALLLGILNTLFEEHLGRPMPLPVDGLERMCEAVAVFDAESMSVRCSVPTESIRQLARDFAAAERMVYYGRTGVSAQALGTLCRWLVQLINLVTGNLDRVGGALCTSPALDLAASTSGGHFGCWRSRVLGLPEYGSELPAAALVGEILGEGEGQVRALVTIAGSPVLSTLNGRRFEQALDGLEFMLSIDLYINETTHYAGLILPPTAPLERDHCDTTFNVFAVRNMTRFNEAVLPRPEGTLYDWKIFVGLAWVFAARNGLELKLTLEPQQMIDLGLRAGAYGDRSEHRLSLTTLREHPHGIDLEPLRPNLAPRLKTADQYIQTAPPLFVDDLQRFAAQPLPTSDQLLLIGRRHVCSNSPWMYNYHRLVKGKPRRQLLMHPRDLEGRGLVDGQRVRVRSRVGSVEVEVATSNEMMPGVVSLLHGQGHARSDMQLAIARVQAGASANDLADERHLDLPSGSAALNGLPMEVEAA